MNKGELISAVSETAGLTKTDAGKAIDAFLDIAVKAFKRGEKIMLKDFGTFQVVKRAPRTARDINSNSELKVPSRKVVRFIAGKELDAKIR